MSISSINIYKYSEVITVDQEHYDIRPSRLSEWYLTFCMTFMLLEGVFNNYIMEFLNTPSIWMSFWPWRLFPSEYYFVTLGTIIGIAIILVARKPWHVPIRGMLSLIAIWGVGLIWGIYGFRRGNPMWQWDMRSTFLPSIVLFWGVILAQNIRYDVLFMRFIYICIPFAIVNLVFGLKFFASGQVDYDIELVSFASFKGEYIIMLAYFAVLARSIITRKSNYFLLILFAISILAPLNKPTVASFFMGNIILVLLANFTGQSIGIKQYGRLIIVFVLLGVSLLIFGHFLFQLGEGAAHEFIQNRYLKSQTGGGHDLSGKRFDLWLHCLETWSHNPIFGTGLGTKAGIAVRQGQLLLLAIHNIVIQTLMQTGILGLFIIIMAIMPWYFRMLRTLSWHLDPIRLWPRLAFCTFILCITFSLFYGDTLSIRNVAYIFWLMVAFESASHSQLIYWHNTQPSDNYETI